MSTQYLLGPQNGQSNLHATIQQAGCSGPIVIITAGWRDSEGETEELQAAIGQPVEDLMIYHRAEEIFTSEPRLHALHRERQDKLAELQSLYRIRLHPAMAAARRMLRTQGHPDLIRLEQRAAIAQVRALDRHHVRRITTIHQEFDARRAELDLPQASAMRDAVHAQVARAGLVLIAGGHVAVLLNRIRLFRLGELLASKTLVAWSAGAMVLSDRIVLFHDNAPQGKRDAEILDAGLGITTGLVPLPHAKSRLDWSSPTRMALFSRRFSPSHCHTLDPGSLIQVKNHKVVRIEQSSVISRNGKKRVRKP